MIIRFLSELAYLTMYSKILSASAESVSDLSSRPYVHSSRTKTSMSSLSQYNIFARISLCFCPFDKD